MTGDDDGEMEGTALHRRPTNTSGLSSEVEEDENENVSRVSQSPISKPLHVADMAYTRQREATVVTPFFGGMLYRQGYWKDWARRYMELKDNTLRKSVRKGGW